MAKRFIDTNIFRDEWFCGLSKESKLFFFYFITNCDHAGVLKLNKKLCELETGIKNISISVEELNNCLLTIKDGLLWMPIFVKFQYPDFPKSNVHQQVGAIKILNSHGLDIEQIKSYLRVGKELTKTSLTLNEELDNSYVNDNDNVLVVVDEKKETLHPIQKYIKESLINVSKLSIQLTDAECERLLNEYKREDIWQTLLNMENHKDLVKKYTSVNLTLRNWIKKVIEDSKKSKQNPTGLI